jgi:protein involved in polysaccharide export with SLBB domain
MHVLYEAGGPGELGSYREIELIRDGKVVGTLDLYAFMRTGRLGVQEGLRDGDIVRIPVYRNRINLMGEFKRPGLYELLEGESLAQAIDYAGGFTEGGFRGQVLMFRVGDQELSVADVPAAEYPTASVREGDVVVANPLRNRYENRVAVTGGVVRPGYYAWTPGMTSDDLVARAQGLDRSVSRTKAVLVRRPEGENGRYLEFLIGQERQELFANDSIYIPSYTDLAVFDSVQVRGFVNRPGNFVYYEGLTLEQAVLLAGGIKSVANVALAEVTVPKRNSEGEFTGQQSVTQVELNWSSPGTKLTPGATVSIRKRKNLNTSKLVHVRGAVSVEGGYSLMDDGEPLSNLLTRLGPLPQNALPAFALVVRKGPERQILEPMDSLRSRTVWIQTQDTIAINLANARQRNRVRLLDGDTLIIPARTNAVLVRGAVKNEGGHSLVLGKRAKYYIKNSGGYDTEAVRRSTVVTYANGRSAEVRYFAGLLPVYPRVFSNSEITVNYKPEDREKADPAQIAAISSIMTSLSSLAIGVFYLLRP